MLRCASASCYDEVYGRDALEEGEVDTERGRAFRSCAREELRRLRGYQTFGTGVTRRRPFRDARVRAVARANARVVVDVV